MWPNLIKIQGYLFQIYMDFIVSSGVGKATLQVFPGNPRTEEPSRLQSLGVTKGWTPRSDDTDTHAL